MLTQRHERGVEAAVGHAEIRQHLVDRAAESLGRLRREATVSVAARSRSACAADALALLERAKIELGGVDEIELRARRAPRLDHVGERRAVLLRETEQQIAPAPHLLEPLRIELDARLVLASSRARAPRGCSTRCRRAPAAARAWDRRAGSWRAGARPPRAAAAPTPPRPRCTRRCPSTSSRSSSAFSRRRASSSSRTSSPSMSFARLDLLHDVAQVVGALLGVGAAAPEIGDLAPHAGERVVRVAHGARTLRRAGEGVEDAALRVADRAASAPRAGRAGSRAAGRPRRGSPR